MKIKLILMAALISIGLSSCNSGQSLQEYFVENRENANFISLDVPSSILNLEEVSLTDSQREAVNSIKKLNVLAFQNSASKASQMALEVGKIKNILNQPKWEELMKFNSKMGKGVVKVIGSDDSIDEVVLFGSDAEKGFLLVRVLGNDMNPANLVPLVQALEKSDYSGEEFKQIMNF